MLYRFNLVEGPSSGIDAEGVDLLNIVAARAYAIAAARSIIADDVLCGTLALSHSIEIATEDGIRLMIVRFADAVTTDQPLTI